MKLGNILFIILISIGCGNVKQDIDDITTLAAPKTRSFNTTDHTFQPYTESFYDHIKDIRIDIPINFLPLKAGIGGQCVTYYTGEKEIFISMAMWPELGEIQRMLLIWHEMGHCHLNRAHDYGIVDGRPASIMYPYVLDDELFLDNEDYYIRELRGY